MSSRKERLIEQYRQIHVAVPRYGTSSEKQIEFVAPWVKRR
ncbi:hypothetical protein [Magnetococcus sp. PR-3]